MKMPSSDMSLAKRSFISRISEMMTISMSHHDTHGETEEEDERAGLLRDIESLQKQKISKAGLFFGKKESYCRDDSTEKEKTPGNC